MAPQTPLRPPFPAALVVFCPLSSGYLWRKDSIHSRRRHINRSSAALIRQHGNGGQAQLLSLCARGRMVHGVIIILLPWDCVCGIAPVSASLASIFVFRDDGVAETG